MIYLHGRAELSCRTYISAVHATHYLLLLCQGDVEQRVKPWCVSGVTIL